ncbi:MAG: exodeoxyribonuclease III [Sphaerochaetaceae bacterium]|jgi:exodeoxyribonuclease-3|nr:exodeoxyribonuclease III [Sphaerochaetaceae bacterium]
MKLISWNVNGLRAVLAKGFKEYIAKEDPDVVCLQEIKLSEGQLDESFEPYHCYFNYASRKGYSGTAILTKEEPLNVTYGSDDEGRITTAEFKDFYVVTVYTPNSQEGLARLAFRQEWDKAFALYLSELDKSKPVLSTGDFNVAHCPIDIKNPKSNERSAGYTIEEREGFTNLLAMGFTDTFRSLYPDKVEYSWWSYRFKAREKNIGWRIDYWLCSNRLFPSIKDSRIDAQTTGSDHCPVILDL